MSAQNFNKAATSLQSVTSQKPVYHKKFDSQQLSSDKNDANAVAREGSSEPTAKQQHHHQNHGSEVSAQFGQPLQTSTISASASQQLQHNHAHPSQQ